MSAGAGGHGGAQKKGTRVFFGRRKRLPSPFLRGEIDEQLGVGVGALGAADDEGVAALFAFAADPGGDEPHGGMEKQQ